LFNKFIGILLFNSDSDSMFSNFDINLAILACVAWLGNPLQHSCYEIVIAAIPYGLKFQFTGEKNSVQLINEIIDKVNQKSESSSKSKGGKKRINAKGV